MASLQAHYDRYRALAGDPRQPQEVRERALWVVGLNHDPATRALAFQIANDPEAPLALRRIAAFRWVGADPEAAVAAQDAIKSPWPETVWDATLTIMVDVAHHAGWRQWCRVVQQRAPALAPRVGLMLGDDPAIPQTFALVAPADLEALDLPAVVDIDWPRAVSLGRAWQDSSEVGVHHRVVQEARVWAQRLLALRVAEARYQALVEWESWLAVALGIEVDPVPPPPEFTAVGLDAELPADVGTARVLLGALAWCLKDKAHRDAIASTRLSSHSAACHLATATAYQNAQITAWHVGSYTGQLDDALWRSVGQ